MSKVRHDTPQTRSRWRCHRSCRGHMATHSPHRSPRPFRPRSSARPHTSARCMSMSYPRRSCRSRSLTWRRMLGREHIWTHSQAHHSPRPIRCRCACHQCTWARHTRRRHTRRWRSLTRYCKDHRRRTHHKLIRRSRHQFRRRSRDCHCRTEWRTHRRSIRRRHSRRRYCRHCQPRRPSTKHRRNQYQSRRRWTQRRCMMGWHRWRLHTPSMCSLRPLCTRPRQHTRRMWRRHSRRWLRRRSERHLYKMGPHSDCLNRCQTRSQYWCCTTTRLRIAGTGPHSRSPSPCRWLHCPCTTVAGSCLQNTRPICSRHCWHSFCRLHT